MMSTVSLWPRTHTGNEVDRDKLSNSRSGNEVDRDKLSNSRSGNEVDRIGNKVKRIGNKVERIRQQLTLLPVSATVDFQQSRPP